MIALGGQALFCLAYGTGLLVFDPTYRWMLEAISLIGLGWIGPLFLAFSLDYTGRRNLIRGRLFLPFVGIATLATTLLITTGKDGLVISGYEQTTVVGLSVATYTIEPIGYVAFVSGLIAAGIGVLLLVETVLSYGPLYRREATAVMLSTVAPTVGILLWLFELGPTPALNLTAALFLPHVVFDAYAFVGTAMFESNPTTRRAAERNAISDLPNPVIVLDTNGRVVDRNSQAKQLEPTETRDVLGAPIESVFSVGETLNKLSQIEETEVRIDQSGDRRLFHVSAAPLNDPTGRTVGSMLIFQDITRAQRREQRLDVLNRVLRHNLRNGMVAIKGNAQYIAEITDDETTKSSAETIATSGDRLITVANKARAFEEIRETAPSFKVIELGELLTELIERLTQTFPDATIDLDVPEETTVRTDPRLLRLLVSNLVENALQHGGDQQRVTVRVKKNSSAVAIEISDEEKGIPKGELEPLRDGEETPLKHGSGIGLWIVHWSTEILGCELQFETDNGTTVTVTIPEEEV